DADGLERQLGPRPAVFFRYPATLLPDIPAYAVRLVVQVEQDSRMVPVRRRQLLPERQAILVGHYVLTDMLAPLPGVRPVQVQHHVTAPVRAGVHDLLDQTPVRLALVLLLGCFSEPTVLR